MGNHQSDRHGNRRRLWWAAALIAVAAAVAVAVGAGVLRAGTPGDSPSAEQAAQQRCQAEVMKKLVSPDTATISELHTQTGTLDAEGRDFSSLNANDQLKGVDASRITVLNVSGVANAPSQVGTMIADHFDCRAYFVDGALTHTLVVFDHAH